MVAEVSRPYGDCRGSPTLAAAAQREAVDPLGRTGRDDDGAILAGVARDLAVRMGVDPLWIRIAFVVLAVFGGLGVLLYGGSWLIFRGRRRSPSGPLVVAGVAVIVVTCVVLLDQGTSYIDSPWTIVFVLAGVAVALWTPVDHRGRRHGCRRPSTAPISARLAASPSRDPLGARSLGVGVSAARRSRWGDRLPARRRRSAPGTMARRCRRGLRHRDRHRCMARQGVLAGRARPAVRRLGIRRRSRGPRRDRRVRSRHAAVWVDSARPIGLPNHEDLVAGEIEVTLFSAPLDDSRSDLRVGLGVIDIVVDDDVTIDVRAHVYDGDIVVDGVEQSNDGDVQIIRIGSGETAEAVISATVSVGRLEVTGALTEHYFSRATQGWGLTCRPIASTRSAPSSGLPSSPSA